MPVLHMEPTIQGLNARDSLDGLEPNQALELINWVPDVGYMRSRNGYIPYRDVGTGSPVETMIPIRLAAGSRLLVVSGLKIFDVTDPNLNLLAVSNDITLPEPLVTNRMTYAQFKSRTILTQPGIVPMIFTVDSSPQGYTMVSGVFTEFIDPDLPPDPRLVISNLIKPLVFKGRVIYVDAVLQSLWYCQAGSFQGEVTELPLDTIFQRGGNIRLALTWSTDTGDGMDDMLVVMSSTGETLIYQGDNPDDSLGWELIQRYQLPTPIADLGVDRIGTETIIITEDGYINLAQALTDGIVSDYAAFSGSISRLVKRDLDFFQDNYGWSAVFYPRGNMILFNVPIQENKEHYQHVMNTRNNAWTTFKGWNANSMVSFDDTLLFGDTEGRVWIADRGTSDNGDFIECYSLSAFFQYGQPSLTKHMTAMTVIHNHAFPESFSLDALADFQRPNLPPLVKPQERDLGEWDISNWDEDYWGVDGGIISGKKYRRPIQATGHSIALAVRQQSKVQTVFWFASTIEFTLGGRK